MSKCKRIAFSLPIFISLIISPLLISAQSESSIEPQEYLIGSQDALIIKVYEEPELDREVRVSSNGEISFPLLGKVKVAGLTVSQLEDKLTELLGKDYLVKPQVTVFIEEYSTISVFGKVNKPGSFPLKGNLTVLEAISLAEGLAKTAAPNKTKIIRIENGEEKTIYVRIADITKRGDKSKDVYLKAGDIVIVPESFF